MHATSTGLSIEMCRNGDVPALMRFIDEHWRRGHVLSRDEALLRWQYAPHRLAGCEGDGVSVLVARAAGRIVGMLGLIGLRLNLLGRRVKGVWYAMWLATPEVRNRGVGLRLLQAAGGGEAAFVLGINDAVEQLYGRLGFELLPDLPRWLAVLDEAGAMELLGAANPCADAGALRELCRRHAAPEPTPDGSIEITDHKGPLGEDWDDFWGGQLAPSLICGDRDAGYLNWRYVRHPSFRYHLHLARDRTGIRGLAVFRIEPVRNSTHRVLRVVEFLALGNAAGALAASVLGAGRRRGAALADFYCTRPAAAAGLEARGLRRVDAAAEVLFPCRFQPLEGGAFRLRGAFWLSPALRAEFPSLLDRTDLHITRSDGDMDRPN